ncbi:MAG: hypothetical protein NTW31_08810 [Bacteroidetes bacterium]|nr:hypothetical protein [Bacteroidota bacterium]
MKKVFALLLTIQLLISISTKLFSQSDPVKQDFGISAGGFTNFPATKDYLTKYISVVYIAPYIQVGRHEFSAGLVCPMSTGALYFTDNNIYPSLGAIAGYKFYVFNAYYRENLFIHYSFQYLRFKAGYDISSSSGIPADHYTETDMYINNVIGLGYNLYFDTEGRFGLYYTLDYMISQTGYKLSGPGSSTNWVTNYVWNNLSTHIGLIFKITPLKKNIKK